MAETVPREAAVYRLYDSGDQLLYVGIANDPKARFIQHRREKVWWPQVAVREVVWFADRERALKEEARAIERELPRFNDVGVQWPHHRLGEAPARVIDMTTLRIDPGRVVDRVAETKQPAVVTRSKVPLAVIVPYFEGADDA